MHHLIFYYWNHVFGNLKIKLNHVFNVFQGVLFCITFFQTKGAMPARLAMHCEKNTVSRFCAVLRRNFAFCKEWPKEHTQVCDCGSDAVKARYALRKKIQYAVFCAGLRSNFAFCKEWPKEHTQVCDSRERRQQGAKLPARQAKKRFFDGLWQNYAEKS